MLNSSVALKLSHTLLCAALVSLGSAVVVHAEESPPAMKASAGTLPGSMPTDAHVLRGQAEVLTSKAAKLQKKTRIYKAHASNYKRTHLHSETGRNSAASTVATSSHHSAIGKAFSKPPQSATVHAERMKALHAEYEHHVEMLRGLVSDYKAFLGEYNEHQAQFRLACKQNSGLAGQVEYSMENPAPQLQSSVVGRKLIGSEKQLAETLKKMNALEDQELPESILCPAFDDLQKELVQAITEVPAYIKMLPPEQASLVAVQESQQLQMLKTEMEQANALHVEQLKLQTEYSGLRAKYNQVSKQQAVVLKEKTEEKAVVEK